MRIFYITSVLGDIGGSEIYCRDLIKEMIARGHEVFVFTTAKNFKMPGAQGYYCRVFGHHAFHKWAGLLYTNRAVELAKRFKPDVVQSHSNSMMGMIGEAVAKNLGVPHVLLIELISGENRNIHTKAIFAWEKFFLPRVKFDKLVVWTENMKRRYCIPWGIQEQKIEVIPAALNEKNYLTAKDGADGSEVQKKFGKHLITSIKGLWGTNVEGLKFVVNKAEELKQLAAEEGVSSSVILAGPLNPQKDPKLAESVAAATEIAPHSYVYEFSTSISLLEYMAWGKAMVVTDIGAVRDFVGDAAEIVEAKNPNAIAEGIIKLIENPSYRKELERRARKRFLEKYSIGASVGRLEKIYSGLLKNA
jgi:glycosyltransferase involved in cell wall biosynthesis